MILTADRRDNLRLKLWRWFAFGVVFMLAVGAQARGGGGCLEQGTLIATPNGEVAIEKLQPGDAIWSVVEGKLQSATVEATRRVEPVEYVEIAVAGRNLRATSEHPFQIGPGIFRIAASLCPGERLFLRDGGELKAFPIDSITCVTAAHPAYNLLVLPGGTYIANGVVVHNKGCFLPDTPVLRADGTESPISEIQPGDQLLAFTISGEIVSTTVRNIITHDVDQYLVVATSEATLRVTREHPFYVGSGTFKTLESLKVGDEIFSLAGGKLQPQRIISLKTIQAPTRVYNLQTDHPNTYFASGVAVHNKGGGCFPAGTRVSTSRGEIAIEKLQPGATVFGMDADGNTAETAIEAVHQTRSALVVFETDQGALRTTREHPLLSSSGDFLLAAEFQPGDRLVVWNKGQCQTATILHIAATTEEEVVYNLQVGEPHTFIADGFVVHNKGGGGFHGGFHGGGSSGGGSGDPRIGLVFVGIFVVVVIYAMINGRSSGGGDDEDLDYIYSRSAIEPKAAKTQKLLEFLARVDRTMTPAMLANQAQTTFLKLQSCWQEREYQPMESLLMPDLYA